MLPVCVTFRSTTILAIPKSISLTTPLGVMIWILYLIPLFLTAYLSWKYAPLILTGIFILLMAVTLFLSPRDISLEYAILDRAFFALILVISSVFIDDYVANVEGLGLSEKRYRHLIEWLPEGVIVCRQEKITFVNSVAVRLLRASNPEELIGLNITDMIDPGFQVLFRERIAQAELGALMNIDSVQIVRLDGSGVEVGMSLGAVSWDKGPTVQIIMRNS